jgi:hypothetical protein
VVLSRRVAGGAQARGRHAGTPHRVGTCRRLAIRLCVGSYPVRASGRQNWASTADDARVVRPFGCRADLVGSRVHSAHPAPSGPAFAPRPASRSTKAFSPRPAPSPRGKEEQRLSLDQGPQRQRDLTEGVGRLRERGTRDSRATRRMSPPSVAAVPQSSGWTEPVARQTRRVGRSLCAKWLAAGARARWSGPRWRLGGWLGTSERRKRRAFGTPRMVEHRAKFASRMELGMAARSSSQLD